MTSSFDKICCEWMNASAFNKIIVSWNNFSFTGVYYRITFWSWCLANICLRGIEVQIIKMLGRHSCLMYLTALPGWLLRTHFTQEVVHCIIGSAAIFRYSRFLSKGSPHSSPCSSKLHLKHLNGSTKCYSASCTQFVLRSCKLMKYSFTKDSCWAYLL